MVSAREWALPSSDPESLADGILVTAFELFNEGVVTIDGRMLADEGASDRPPIKPEAPTLETHKIFLTRNAHNMQGEAT